MIEQARAKARKLAAKASGPDSLVGDIVHCRRSSRSRSQLVVAMGDPLSICSDPSARSTRCTG
jgi:hypothetical protein